MSIKKNQEKEETENRLDNLINVVEKRERTERHLEQYSDAKDDERLEPARRLQDIRNEEIENIKNNITGNQSHNTDEFDNLKRNYEYTQNYLDNNKDHMKDEDIKNLEEKQQNRKDELDNY